MEFSTLMEMVETLLVKKGTSYEIDEAELIEYIANDEEVNIEDVNIFYDQLQEKLKEKEEEVRSEYE